MNKNSRNESIFNIIEKIPNIESVSEIEIFQNDIIRPIIKFQHELIVMLLKEELNLLELISENHTRNEIKNQLAKNIPLKNQLIGIIVGLFTEEDYKRYLNHKKESNKRIIQIIISRYLSVLYKKV